jgi:hypothetical protein
LKCIVNIRGGNVWRYIPVKVTRLFAEKGFSAESLFLFPICRNSVWSGFFVYAGMSKPILLLIKKHSAE